MPTAEIAILDVGAGRQSSFRVDGAHLVGLDPSAAELAENPHLDERIVGTIEDAVLPPASFQVVVLWDVLEHLDKPRAALSKLAETVALDGAIVIAAPDPLSLKGLVTKFTPLWFHRLMIRRLLPFVEREPFPTYLRFAMRPAAVEAWARDNGFEVSYFRREEARIQQEAREKLRLRGWRWTIVRGIFRAATLGFGSAASTDYRMVLRRTDRVAAGTGTP
jgi:2-polyprenyl-3-methyl-5-hydroxy-6-metoxy-1,4-benzoquinol methylase